jgi:hypothetical protein
MLKLKKDNKVIYLGNMPYKLGNGQEVSVHGEELTIISDVIVQKKFFNIIEVKKEVKLELSNSPKKEENKKIDKKLESKNKNKNVNK